MLILHHAQPILLVALRLPCPLTLLTIAQLAATAEVKQARGLPPMTAMLCDERMVGCCCIRVWVQEMGIPLGGMVK